MTQIMKLNLALIVVGGVFVWLGYNEYRLSDGATGTAQPIELAEIEAGRIPENAHLEVGPHWRMYQELLFRYQQKWGSDEVTAETPIEYSYYPILSTSHPFFAELEKSRQAYGGVEQIAEEALPTVETFSMLVKTKQFKTVGDLPDSWAEGEPIQGLVVNRIYKLKKDEAELLTQSFPGIDLANILVLEEGRSPTSSAQVWGFMGGGAACSAGALVWLLWGIRRKPSLAQSA